MSRRDEDHDELRRSGLRRAGRALGVLGGGVVLLGVLAVGVFPTQTYLDQRRNTTEAEQRLAVLGDQNAAYKARIRRLQTAEEIERLAREQYNLVLPGEEAYAVLPAPLPPLELPTVWPFGPMIPAGADDAAGASNVPTPSSSG